MKQQGSDWVTFRTPFLFPQSWNYFPLSYRNGKSVQENEICLFRWKSRTGCSTPLWRGTTCSHFHGPVCSWDLSAQQHLHPRFLRHLEMGQQISEQPQEPTQGLNAPILDTWDLGKAVLPRSRKTKQNKTFAELYLIKMERTGTSHTEATNLKYELTAAVCLPDK